MTKSEALSQNSVIVSFVGAGILGSSAISMIFTIPFSVLFVLSTLCAIGGGYMAYNMELKKSSK